MTRSYTSLGYLNAIYMSIYSHMQPYKHVFKYIFKLQTYIYILLYLFAYFLVTIYAYIHIYTCILECFSLHLISSYIFAPPSKASSTLLHASYTKLLNASTILTRHNSTWHQHCILKHKTTEEVKEIAKQ